MYCAYYRYTFRKHRITQRDPRMTKCKLNTFWCYNSSVSTIFVNYFSNHNHVMPCLHPWWDAWGGRRPQIDIPNMRPSASSTMRDKVEHHPPYFCWLQDDLPLLNFSYGKWRFSVLGLPQRWNGIYSSEGQIYSKADSCVSICDSQMTFKCYVLFFCS